MSKTTVYKILVDKDQAIQSLKDLDEMQDELGGGFLSLKSKIIGGLDNPLKKIANTGNILKTKLLSVPTKIGLGFKSLQRKVNSFSFRRMQVHARRFERRMLAIPRRIRAGFSKLQNKLGGFGSAILGGLAVREIASGIGAAVNAASDRQEALNVTKTVFGDHFAEISKFTKRSDETLGISRTKALATSATFASLFKNTGIAGDQVAKWTKASLQLGADLASFKNLEPDEAMRSLLAGLKGETEPLSKFGLVLDEASLKQKAFEMGLIKTFKGTMPKAIRTQAIFGLVLDQTKDAQGDFNKTQNDYANSLRTLRAGVRDLSVDLGELFLPYALKLVRWLKTSVKWIKENKDQVKSWIKTGLKWTGVVIGMWGALKLFLGITSIVNGIMTLTTAIKAARTAMIGFNLVAAMNPFGWIILAVAGIATLIYHWDDARIWIKDHPIIGNILMPGLPQVLDDLTAFKKIIDDLLADFRLFDGWLTRSLNGFAEFINQKIPVLGWIDKQFNKLIGNKNKKSSDDWIPQGPQEGGAGRPNRGTRNQNPYAGLFGAKYSRSYRW